MKRPKYMHLAAESYAFVTPFSGKVPFALQSYRIIDHLWLSNRVKAHENPYNTWTRIPVSKWSKKHVCIYAVYIYLYIYIYTVVYCIILYCTILYHMILYCIILYYIMFCFIILYIIYKNIYIYIYNYIYT